MPIIVDTAPYTVVVAPKVITPILVVDARVVVVVGLVVVVDATVVVVGAVVVVVDARVIAVVPPSPPPSA